MKQLLLVFLGGGAGSMLRYLISRALNTYTAIPLGTLTVNIIGSLFIGIIFGAALKQNLLSNNMTLLLATGFCGGFTTFSSFAHENFDFFRSGDLMNFALYSIGSLVLGLLAVMLGLYLAR